MPDVENSVESKLSPEPIAQTYQSPQNFRSNKKLLILLLIILTVLIAGAAWYIWSNKIFTKKSSNANLNNNIENVNKPQDNVTTTNEQVFPNPYSLSEFEEDELRVKLLCYISKNTSAVNYFPALDKEKDARDYQEFYSYLSDSVLLSASSSEDFVENISFCNNYSNDDNFITHLITTDSDKDGVNLYMEANYGTSDEKSDTDGDGYSDLIEIKSGHQANDNLETEQYKIIYQVHELIKSGEFDSKQANDLCLSTYRSFRDECLWDIINYTKDQAYCDQAKFYSSLRSNKERCLDIISGHQVAITGEPADCLKLSESQQIYCLSQEAVLAKSLAPCELAGESFNECADNDYVLEVISSQDCIAYADKLSQSLFAYNDCIFSAAINENNIDFCYNLSGSMPDGCIWAILDQSEAVCKKYGGTFDSTADVWSGEKPCSNVDAGLFKAKIGVYYIDINKKIAQERKLPYNYGILLIVEEMPDLDPVIYDSPAEKAGLKKGDIVLEINKVQINANKPFAQEILKYKPGDEVILKVWSDGKIKEVKVTLGGL